MAVSRMGSDFCPVLFTASVSCSTHPPIFNPLGTPFFSRHLTSFSSRNMALLDEASSFLYLHSPDVLISSDSYAGQIPGLMTDNLPAVGTAFCSSASLLDAIWAEAAVFISLPCPDVSNRMPASIGSLAGTRQGVLLTCLAANYFNVAEDGGPCMLL